MPQQSTRLIDRLAAAPGFTTAHRYPYELRDSDDNLIETIYFGPLTMAERDRARQASKDGSADFVIQLLIQKAELADKTRAFQSGDAAALKNSIQARQLDKILDFIMEAGGLKVTLADATKSP